MKKLVVEGGVTLSGEIAVGGAKNAILPIMAAALLTREECVIRNCPDVTDVDTMQAIIASLGVAVEREGSSVRIRAAEIKSNVAPYDFVRKMRASICLLGALVGRQGNARVSIPGGCVIGPRPIDLHLKGLAAMGVDIKMEHGYVEAARPAASGENRGEVFLCGRYGPSVLGTANVMMAAAIGRGRTTIECAACEPEVVDLADFLVSMGAKISGAGSPRIVIDAVAELGGTDYTIIPDRIEAGTYMLAAAITGGRVRVANARMDHLHALADKMLQAGVGLRPYEGGIEVSRTGPLKAIDLITHSYPGFPTDLQAQMMALMTVTPGISVVTEKIYPERFMHVAELNRMAANIALEGPNAIIKGVESLSGAPVMASDLRASAALIIAALRAKGTTEIKRIYHLDRGYEALEEKFAGLGARIRREDDV